MEWGQVKYVKISVSHCLWVYPGSVNCHLLIATHVLASSQFFSTTIYFRKCFQWMRWLRPYWHRGGVATPATSSPTGQGSSSPPIYTRLDTPQPPAGGMGPGPLWPRDLAWLHSVVALGQPWCGWADEGGPQEDSFGPVLWEAIMVKNMFCWDLIQKG